MNGVSLKDFLMKFSNEKLEDVKFEWLSVVFDSPSNRIYAEMHVKTGSVIVTNKQAESVYGRTRRIREITEEWIHTASMRRTIRGPIIKLDTFL